MRIQVLLTEPHTALFYGLPHALSHVPKVGQLVEAGWYAAREGVAHEKPARAAGGAEAEREWR